jgi:hypothetical protein
MAVSNIYQGKSTGGGMPVPVLSNGGVNLNALMNAMVSRDIWAYYYTLKVAPATTFPAQYSLFNYISGQTDPYAITAGQILSHVETNMPSPASNGFSAPRDLIMDQLGFYFLASGCGLANSGIGTFANVSDMLAFCQYSYFEFKIVDKIFIEGFLELNPPGVGFSGVSTGQQQSVYTLGMVNPHAVNRLGKDFAKYLSPQLQWSLTIYFPSGSGPAGVAGATLTQANGGNGLWLRTFIKGLTDRAVQ